MRLRSLLFCPGNRPEMMAKLAAIGADCVAIDLEDGVPVDAKVGARQTAREGASLLAGQQVFIRVNGTDTPWIEDDIASAVGPSAAGIILPKLESVSQLEWVAAQLDAAGLREAKIIGGLETALGIEEAPRLAHPRLVAVYFGAEDYIADVGGERTPSSHEVAYARARTVMAARIIGVAPIDQVVVEVKNDERYLAEAVTARQLGFTGKICLHPAQVPLANQVFTPGEGEIQRARRLLSAVADARRESRGTVLFEGAMVDVPLIRQAEQVLARAGLEES
ncbi:MAG: CoA ester lyase [Acidimicrobiaceae bacterium]|nr:CoA ester lyase [Acidimicrobiaceae bacterium]